MTTATMARSSDWTNKARPTTTLATTQGMSSRQNIASRVPTQLARAEFSGLPCMSKAKLVVMPHDGQGTCVILAKVQGGSPSCRCVAMRCGEPSAS